MSRCRDVHMEALKPLAGTEPTLNLAYPLLPEFTFHLFLILPLLFHDFQVRHYQRQNSRHYSLEQE